jgi:hypothetical protein
VYPPRRYCKAIRNVPDEKAVLATAADPPTSSRVRADAAQPIAKTTTGPAHEVREGATVSLRLQRLVALLAIALVRWPHRSLRIGRTVELERYIRLS